MESLLSTVDPVRAARLRAATAFPYLQSAIWSMALVKTEQVETMAVDTGWRCYYNERAMRQLDVEEVGAIFVHEVWHLLRSHFARAERLGINLDDFQGWNVATDCEINDDVIAQGGKLPDWVLRPERYGWDPNELAESYYQKILKKEEEDPEFQFRGACDPSFGGSCADNIPRPYELDRSHREAPAKDDAQAELIRRQVAREIVNSGCGHLPGQMKRWAEAKLEPPKVNWRRELMANVRHAFAQVVGKTDYTFRKFGRRSNESAVRPSMISFRPNVTVVVDTSGSVDQNRLAMAINETHHVIKTLNSPVTVIACDSQAEVSEKVFNVKAINLKGGGGTEMGEGIRAAMQQKPMPDIVVTITDGITSWPAEAPAARHITVLTNERGNRPRFGKTVVI
jgi:predicted metal-dependent peptidase